VMPGSTATHGTLGLPEAVPARLGVRPWFERLRGSPACALQACCLVAALSTGILVVLFLFTRLGPNFELDGAKPALNLHQELVVPPETECVFAVPALDFAISGSAEFPHAVALSRCIRDKGGEPILRVDLKQGILDGVPVDEFLSLSSNDGRGLAFCRLPLPPGKEASKAGESVDSPTVSIYQQSGDLFAVVNEHQTTFWAGRGSRGCPCGEAQKPEADRAAGTGGAAALAAPAEPAFVLWTAATDAWQLRFYGDVASRRVNVFDTNMELMATVEPGHGLCFNSAADKRDSVAGAGPEQEHYVVRTGAGCDAGLVLCGLLALDRLIAAWGISPRHPLPANASKGGVGPLEPEDEKTAATPAGKPAWPEPSHLLGTALCDRGG